MAKVEDGNAGTRETHNKRRQHRQSKMATNRESKMAPARPENNGKQTPTNGRHHNRDMLDATREAPRWSPGPRWRWRQREKVGRMP